MEKATLTPEQEAAVRDRNWCWKCASAMVVDVHSAAGIRFMQCKHCKVVYALAASPDEMTCRHADMCNEEGTCANGCEERKAVHAPYKCGSVCSDAMCAGRCPFHSPEPRQVAQPSNEHSQLSVNAGTARTDGAQPREQGEAS